MQRRRRSGGGRWPPFAQSSPLLTLTLAWLGIWLGRRPTPAIACPRSVVFPPLAIHPRRAVVGLLGGVLAAPPPAPALEPLGRRGLKITDVRVGTGLPAEEGSVVRVQWSGRLAAKQGASYGRCAEPECELRFLVGGNTTIAGLDEGVRGMREGGLRRLVIPPPLAYQEGRELQPLPADEAGRTLLVRTVFNPTRIANGEGDTLGTIVLDVSLRRVYPRQA